MIQAGIEGWLLPRRRTNLLAVLEPGTRFGGNTLVSRIGLYGSREVWEAQDLDGRAVTVRLARVCPDRAAAVEARLREELDLVGWLRHPNVLRVLGAGVQDGWAYVVSEEVSGPRLRELLDRARADGPWPSPFLAGFVAHQLARGLMFAHELPGPDGQPLGALRHALTPEAVIVERSGAVKLAELVSVVDVEDSVQAAEREPVGVTAYQSPEVAAHAARSARRDVFALGSIFWELLTGSPPVRRGSDREALQGPGTGDLPSMPPGLPGELCEIAERCIGRRPEDRFGDAWAVSRALEGVLEGRSEAGPRAMRRLIEDIERNAAPRRTALLSSDAQRPASQDAPDTATDVRPAMGGPVADDPFFDPVRDAGAFSNPRFEIIAPLGSGAMGEVYKVRDVELDEVVALKRLPRHAAGSRQSLERLKREVRLARRIASVNVCRIFDIVDLGDGERGLTMAVVEGRTMGELMQDHLRLDYKRFARWGADIAEGLAAAHGLNIVHRDLKPDNVMIQREDDRAVLLDFGIARPRDSSPKDPQLTQLGIIMGTPLYMSPEQLTNSSLDGRSDLYGLGLILAELVTGEVPHEGRTYAELLDRRVRANGLYRLHDVDPGAPAALADIVDRLLAPAAAERPATATQVAARLRAFADGEPPTAGEARVAAGTLPEAPPAPPTGPETSEPVAAPPKSNRAALSAVGLTVLVVAVGVWVSRQARDAGAEPPAPRPRVAAASPDAGVPDAAVEPDAGATAPDAGGVTPRPRVKKRRREWLPPAEEM